MKQKKTLLLLIALVVLIGGAGVLYKILADKAEIPSALTPVENPTATSLPPDQQETPSEQAEAPAEEEVPPAPNFKVYDKEGNPVEYDSFVGKPIVLNFWASWCGPCKMEMPHFQEAYEKYGDGEVEFLMINMTAGRETQSTAEAFVEEGGYTFPVYFDTEEIAAATYGVYSLPTSIFIDKDGYIAAYAEGAITADMLEEGIRRAFENPTNK